MKPRIGIRPTIDGRWGGVRESLEEKTMAMANAAKELIESNVHYQDGTPVECVISPCTIGSGAEAAKCNDYFSTQNVCATLAVTPCWCYGSETMDLNSDTVKAVWGFNGTERPGAVYLAAVMAAFAQRGLPAFSMYGHDVQDIDDNTVPEDVAEKMIRWAKGAVAVGQMKNKAYVNLGSVAMGIAGSYCDMSFMQKYLGIRAEFVDLTEILRRITLVLYVHHYEKAVNSVYTYQLPHAFFLHSVYIPFLRVLAHHFHHTDLAPILLVPQCSFDNNTAVHLLYQEIFRLRHSSCKLLQFALQGNPNTEMTYTFYGIPVL